MLKQLSRLSIETDGRYATAEELQFLHDYLQSVEQRIDAYKKIRDSEEQIADRVAEKMREADPNVFRKGDRDMSAICKRDRKHTLRCSSAAMLVDDLERLQNGLLLWQRTIVQAFSDSYPTEVTYQVMPEVIKEHLTAEEAELIMPAIELDGSVLAA